MRYAARSAHALLVLAMVPLLACAEPRGRDSAGEAEHGAQRLGVGDTPTRARAADGRFISWREHRIDDTELGGVAISGSDGLAMSDLDLDGHLDIASVHESDTEYTTAAEGHVRLAFGSADPDGWELRTVAEGEAAGSAEDVVATDLDGDGYPDLVVACEQGHVLFLANPGADARTAPWPQLVVPGTVGRGSFIRVAAGDFDGDGRPEVAAANKGAPFAIERGRSGGAAATETERPLRPISWFSIAGDPLDGDSWVEHVLIEMDWPINVETVDLDGDGDLDLFAGSRGELRIMWFENTGERPLAFVHHEIETDTSTVPAGERPPELGDSTRGLVTGFNVDFEDLSGDGRLDLVLREGNFLVWLEQPEGPASPWALHRIGSMAPDNLVGLTLADIDGDGDADVFAGGYSAGPRDRDGDLGPDGALGGLSWFENPGAPSGAWTRHDVSRRQRGMFDELVARDMDGDGDVDFVSTRGNSAPWDGVFWLEQVRTESPVPSFARAREQDSEEMPRPAVEPYQEAP